MNNIDYDKVEEELFKNEIYQEIMQQFEDGQLMRRGKGNIEVPVTNPKQAYAIAMSMCERNWKRHKENQNLQKLNLIVSTTTPEYCNS